MDVPDPLAPFYADPPLIRGERLVFRPFGPADAMDVFDYAGRPGIDAHTSWSRHESPADALHFIEHVACDPGRRHLALAMVLDGRVIGSFGITADQQRGGEVSLGYVVSPDHAGQGLATEALRAWTAWAGGLPGVHTVKAFILQANIASARVAQKAGYVDERPAEPDEVPDARCVGARTFVHRG